MKKENISAFLSGIDEKYIEEATKIKKKHSTIIRYTSIAACFIVAIIAGVLLSNPHFSAQPPVSTDTTTAAASPESGNGENKYPEIATEATDEIVTEPATETVTETGMMIMPQWDDLTLPMRYMEAVLGDITYFTQNTEISAENVLAFMGDTTMTGYDIYEDKTYTVNAQIYSVKSISTECAVAVRIDGSEEYYMYINTFYEPDTLGDFISDLDLKNTVSFRKAYIDIFDYTALSSTHRQIVYSDFDDNVIWDMLSDVLTAENTKYNHPYDRISVETDLEILGYKNISFCITPDGYIITNILNTQKCFFVGTEKFDYFDKYLKDNVPFKEYNTVYELNPDGSIPGKGDSSQGQSTPGYNPDEPVTTPAYNPNEDKGNLTETTTSVRPEIPQDMIAEASTQN